MARPCVPDATQLYGDLVQATLDIIRRRQAAARAAHDATYSLAPDTTELASTAAGALLLAAGRTYHRSLPAVTGEADHIAGYLATYREGYGAAVARYSAGASAAVGQEVFMDRTNGALLARGAMFVCLLELWVRARRVAAITLDLGAEGNADHARAVIHALSPWEQPGPPAPSPWARLRSRGGGGLSDASWVGMDPPPPTPATDLEAALADPPAVSAFGRL